MKTRQRTVHFYDVQLFSHTLAEGIANPSCVDLSTLLVEMTTAKPKGTMVVDGRVVQVRLEDWQVDATRGCYLLLLSRADRDVSDVAFRDFSTRSLRKGGKTKVEGIEASSHVVIQPRADGRTALVLITMGAGVNIEHVCRALAELTKTLSTKGKDKLFHFPHPSGERDPKGAPKTYKVRYRFESVAHKSSMLDDSIRAGRFVSMDLIAHTRSAFDSGGNLQVEEKTLTIKESKTGFLGGVAAIKNALAFHAKSHPKDHYDELKVRYKNDHGDVRSTTFAINDLDQAFTRKEVVELDSDVESQQSSISPTVIAAMLKLL
jgi:hypothetical protein